MADVSNQPLHTTWYYTLFKNIDTYPGYISVSMEVEQTGCNQTGSLTSKGLNALL